MSALDHDPASIRVDEERLPAANQMRHMGNVYHRGETVLARHDGRVTEDTPLFEHDSTGDQKEGRPGRIG